MTTIVHLSDPHFGTEVPAVRSAVQRAVHALHPDVIVTTGDITQRAKQEEFAAATRFLQALPAPVKLTTPGNHDIPLFNIAARLLRPYAGYQRSFGARESFWSNEQAGILMLDATSPLRHTRGKLDDAQLARRIREARQSLPDNAVLIVGAHQPLHTAWPQDRAETLIDASASARHMATLQVDLALSGHVHVPLVDTTHQAFPALPRHFILAGAGTALSYRTRAGAPNSFNTIRIAAAENDFLVAVTQHVYDASIQEFKAQPAQRFGRGPGGWVCIDHTEKNRAVRFARD